jgi:hypothetical protein
MPLDLEQIKGRLDSLKKTNKKSNLTWKPSEKEETVRIVPYKFNPENPFIELYFHYELNNKTYLSPASFGERDPIMEIAQKLKSSGDKESWKLGRSLEPRLRTFAPVIVRGKEHEGVKFWGFGKTVYEDILSHISDPDYGDITDPVNGRDIVVWTVKEEGKQFASPKVRIKPNPSQVTDDADVLKKITDEQPDIKELYELKSYEELEDALKKHLNPEEAADEESAETQTETKTETKPETAAETAAETSKEEVKETPAPAKNINDAFKNMFEK